MVDLISFISCAFEKPDTVIAFCALLVSIFSFVLTIITLGIQRNHDKLSVKPLAFFNCNNKSGCISITINNGGLGPMIIKSIETFNTNNPQQRLEWPEITKAMGIGNYNISSITVGKINHTPLINGKSITIFEHKFDVTKSEHVAEAEKIKNVFKNFTIRVKYSNFYDDSFESNFNLHLLGA